MECIYPDAMSWALVVLACVRAHPEPAFGHGDERWSHQERCGGRVKRGAHGIWLVEQGYFS